MSKSDEFTVKGTVLENLKSCRFKISIIENPNIVVEATLSGKLRQNNIRIIEGDTVDVTVSAADPTKGRITWRYK